MVLSVRLDDEELRLVNRLSRRMGKTRSDVLRTALEQLGQRADFADQRERPSRRLAHLLGCVRGGPKDLSARTGQRFAEQLREKARR